jgi:hypothetical protein
VSLPNGVYYYTIEASQTPAPQQLMSSIGNEENLSAKIQSPSLGFTPDGKFEYFEIKFPPFPPGLNLPESIIGLRPVKKAAELAEFQAAIVGEPKEIAATQSLAAPLPTPKVPKRKPTQPVRGTVGKFGIGYYRYLTPRNSPYPRNGIGGNVQIEGISGTTFGPFLKVPFLDKTAQGFADAIKKGAFKQGFIRGDDNLKGIDLKRDDFGIGGNNLFNQVNIGLFMAHGLYGTSLDFTPAAGQTYQTYMGLGAAVDAADPWIRLSEFKFGGGQLRWMGILACNILAEMNFYNMWLEQRLPIEDDFHLLCSGSTVIYFNEAIGQEWARRMVKKNTVVESWFAAGRETYKFAKPGSIPNPVRFRVAGWDSSFADRLNSYVIPDPGIDAIAQDEAQVYP